jgi:hypothetical protein
VIYLLTEKISYATTEEQRVLFYSLNSGAGVLGFILGPVLGALTTFNAMRFQFTLHGRSFNVDDTTYPGYLSAAFMFINMLLFVSWSVVFTILFS